MSTNISRRLLLALGALAMLVSTLLAQKSIPQSRVSSLRQQIQEAEHKRQPKTKARLADELYHLGQKHKSLAITIEGLGKRDQALRSINNAHDLDIFGALDSLLRAPWLTPQERSITAALSIFSYRGYQSKKRRNDGDLSLVRDNIKPKGWTGAHYERRYTELINEMLRPVGILELNVTPYKEMLRSFTGVEAREFSPSFLTNLMSILGGYEDYYYRALTSQELIRPLTRALEQYPKPAPGTNGRLHLEVALLRLRHLAEQKDESYLSALDQLLTSYPNQGDAIYYYALLRDYWRDQHGRRYLIDKIDAILEELKRRGESTSPLAGELREQRALLLRPALSIDGAMYLPASQMQSRIEVRSELIERIDIECLELPLVGEGDKAGTPLLRQTYTLPEDPRWDGRTDTLTFSFPREGRYTLRVVATPYAATKMSNRKYLDTLHIETQVSRYNVLSWRRPQNGQAIVQWLEAENGRPLIGGRVKSIQKEGRADNTLSHTSHDTTDALGRISLEGADNYWLGDLILEAPQEGALSISNVSLWWDRYHNQPKAKTQGQLSLYSDRGVYRPGQEIHLYGIASVVGWHSEQARVVPYGQWQAKLYAPRHGGEPLETKTISSDQLGRLSCTFSLPEGAVAGTYYIRLEPSNQAPLVAQTWTEDGLIGGDLHIEVAHYKRPQMEVVITPPSTPPSFGDSVQLPISVREYSGGGIADALVSVSVEKVYLWPNYYKHTAQTYTLTTNAQGVATLSLKLDTASDQNTSRLNAPIWLLPLWERPAHQYIITASAQSVTGEVQESRIEVFVGDKITSLKLNAPKHIDRDGEATLSFEGQSGGVRPVVVPVAYTLFARGRELRRGSCQSGEQLSARQIFKGLPSGYYQIRYSTPLNQTSLYQADQGITLYSHREHRLTLPDTIPFALLTPKAEYSLGERPRFGYATGLRDAYVYCQVLADNQQIVDTLLRPEAGRLYWHDLDLPSDTTELVTIRAYTMYKGRLVEESYDLRRKQPDKDLTLRWMVFRDRILSGTNEEWRMQVLLRGTPAPRVAIASWMYDASLNAIARPSWMASRRPSLHISHGELFDHDLTLLPLLNERDMDFAYGWSYPEASAPSALASDMTLREEAVTTFASARPQSLRSAKANGEVIEAALPDELAVAEVAPTSSEPPAVPIQLRQNMRELAYCYPRMQTDERGQVSWSFVLPDALTRWRVEVLAHTSTLDYGHITSYVESYRSLQAKAFLPRFLREGDRSSLSASVRNLSDQPQEGTWHIELFDLATDSLIVGREGTFALEPGGMTSCAFELDTPKGYREIGVRVTARSREFADGEQHRLPIIPNVVSERKSLAHTLRQGARAEIDLGALLPASGYIPSEGQLKVRLESQPIYLALLALPEQVETEHENAIDLSAALYAQRLVGYLAQDSTLVPELRRRLERAQLTKQTTDPTILYSRALMQQDESKLIARLIALLEEAPSRGKERALIERLIKIGQDQQGLVPWLVGFKGSASVTELVLRQIIRSRAFLPQGKEDNEELTAYVRKAWSGLERRIAQELEEEQKRRTKSSGGSLEPQLSWGALEYLYLSALDQERKIDAVAHYAELEPRLRKQAHRLSLPEKAKAALIYTRTKPDLAGELVRSIEEYLTYSEEGAFFADEALRAYWWYSRSYETTALSVESISRLKGWEQKEAVAMQEWMLAQKRGVRWESSLATNEALHALMLGGGAKLSQDKGVEVKVISSQGERAEWLAQQRSEQTHLYKGDEYPQRLILSPRDSSMVWVSAEATYPLPIAEQGASGRQITLSRQHFVREVDASGKVQLVPILPTTRLKTGQKIVTQLYLQLDRDLDFVRLSDPRVGCLEPRGVLAGYRWGGGSPHYLEPRDVETAFYFDHLRRGSYTLEYEQVVVRPGTYQTPAAEAVCLYAPEYRASSGVAPSWQVEQERKDLCIKTV